jgi:hypothetical protein
LLPSSQLPFPGGRAGESIKQAPNAAFRGASEGVELFQVVRSTYRAFKEPLRHEQQV